MVTDQELDDIIIDLGRALENATRAKRIRQELGTSPEGALRIARETALQAVRVISRHFPPVMRTPAGV